MNVTIEIPPRLPLLPEIEGDAAGVDVLADTIYAAAARYEEFADTAKRLQSFAWRGRANDAYRVACADASDEHTRMSETVRRVARGVTGFADNLAEMTRTYDDLASRRLSLNLERAGLIADLEAVTDATPEIIANLRARSHDLRLEYAALMESCEVLMRRVRENEDLLRDVFGAADTLLESTSRNGGVPDLAASAMMRSGAPGCGASPEEVRAWWDGLSEAEREAVISAYPYNIGSADGLPADARDQANRIMLDDDLSRLATKEQDGTISALEKKTLANANEARDALANADDYVDPLDQSFRPGGTLWLYDPGAYDGDGRVGIGVGDLDTATDVGVLTPGISTDMQDTGRYTDYMMNLYESTRFNGDGSSVATMFWLGYDAPSGISDSATLSESRAEQGGQQLADAVDGLRASRPDNPAHMTAIGHSYGSTTTAYASASSGLDVDEVTLIGSPGAGPAAHGGDMSVGQDHVYVGRDSRDLVATLGDEGKFGKGGAGLGTDPSSENFDATRFQAENVNRGDSTNFGDAHSSYFDNDTESLYNIGKIVDGHGGDVNVTDQSYDPWWRTAVDPEWDRDPTENDQGYSNTTEVRENAE